MVEEFKRIVIFAGPFLYPSKVETIERVLEESSDSEVLLLLGKGGKGGRKKASYLKRKWRLLTRQPVSYPLSLLARLPQWLDRRQPIIEGSRPALPTLEDLAPAQMRVEHHEYIHEDSSLESCREFAPDIGLSIGAPILKSSLFTIPRNGTINLHKSLLPDYRGLPPGFWEIHDGCATGGVSIHRITKGLDTGDIVCQQPVPIPEFVSPAGLREELDLVGTRLMPEAIRVLMSEPEASSPQSESRTGTNTSPTWLIENRVLRHCRKKRASFLAKTQGKPVTVHCRKGQRGIALVYSGLSECRIDAETFSVEQFGKHLSFLKRRACICDLESFLEIRADSGSIRPVVTLICDLRGAEAYRAARILRREGLPATFINLGELGARRAVGEGGYAQGLSQLSSAECDEMQSWGFFCCATDRFQTYWGRDYALQMRDISHAFIGATAMARHIVRALSLWGGRGGTHPL